MTIDEKTLRNIYIKINDDHIPVIELINKKEENA